jgi:DNA-directed RNA polymerase subunit B'
MTTGVYLNGRLIGEHKNPEQLVKKLKDLRRVAKIDQTISISFHEENNEVHLYTDKGRTLRPLVILDEGKPRLTPKHIKELREGSVKWKQFSDEGLIEYIDAEEEENAYVAIREYKIST